MSKIKVTSGQKKKKKVTKSQAKSDSRPATHTMLYILTYSTINSENPGSPAGVEAEFSASIVPYRGRERRQREAPVCHRHACVRHPTKEEEH